MAKLTGRRAAMNRTLEEASRSIRQRLWSERRDEALTAFSARLREASDVEVNDEALQHVRIPGTPSPEPEAPAAPGEAPSETTDP